MMLSSLGRTVLRNGAKPANSRGMATAQQLKLRVRSVKNTRKITSAMKMVAACKLRGAQEWLESNRDFQDNLDKVFPPSNDAVVGEKPLYIGISADKGLCGAINSSISRAVRDSITSHGEAGENGSIIMVGEKAKQGLERRFGHQFVVTTAEIGGLQIPSFKQVGVLADYWLNTEHDKAYIFYQYFRSMIAYDTRVADFQSIEALGGASAFQDYEMEGDTDILQNLSEFRASIKLYYFLSENEASMLSARMSAMDNSTKNAGEMIEKLELVMNRTRQAKITTELTEIISGAAAVE